MVWFDIRIFPNQIDIDKDLVQSLVYNFISN